MQHGKIEQLTTQRVPDSHLHQNENLGREVNRQHRVIENAVRELERGNTEAALKWLKGEITQEEKDGTTEQES